MSSLATINLNDFINRQKAPSFKKNVAGSAAVPPNKKPAMAANPVSEITDWSKEREWRIAENNKRAADDRYSNYEVEEQFFIDYYNNAHKVWDKVCANQLLRYGEPLKKAIKILGFNPKTNSILGFLTNSFVVKNLLKTGKLTRNKFGAIYDAVSQKLIAPKEYLKENDYNILYCLALYEKSEKDILTYLKKQKEILDPTNSDYAEEEKNLNKKIFFKIPELKGKSIKELKVIFNDNNSKVTLSNANSSGTVLNELSLISKLIADDEDDADDENITGDNSKGGGAVAAITKKLTEDASGAQAFVALQYFAILYKNDDCASALKNNKFSNVTHNQLAEACLEVSDSIKKVKLSDEDLEKLAAALVSTNEKTQV